MIFIYREYPAVREFILIISVAICIHVGSKPTRGKPPPTACSRPCTRRRGVVSDPMACVPARHTLSATDWPLYIFSRDDEPGDANGQGVDDVWWTLNPDSTATRGLSGEDGAGPIHQVPVSPSGGAVVLTPAALF